MSALEEDREVLARALHADDVKHDRAHHDFWLMNEDSTGWYFDNADAILAAGFRRPGPITDAQVLAGATALDPEAFEVPLRGYGEGAAQQARQSALEASRDVLEAAREVS